MPTSTPPAHRPAGRAARLSAILCLAILGGAWLPLAIARPADAQAVPHLTAQVTDDAGVAASGRAELDRALADLLGRAGVQLWVAFVHTTGTDTAADFARATFTTNSLGGNDLLLVVAVDDHRYAWWDDGAIPSLTSGAVDQLLSRTVEGPFRAGDYAGGVGAFADALRAALTETPTAGPTAGPTPTGSSGGGTTPPGGGSALPLLGITLLVAGVAIVVVAGRRWWLGRRTAEERDRRTGELARRANAGLIAADDNVRESSQDLEFAVAQFDDAEVAPFRAALAAAREELTAAFTIRQQLDDATPEDPPTRERMLGEIVDRSGRITSALDEQRRRIQAMREQEQKAPEILADLPTRIAALEGRVPAAEAALGRLAGYSPSSTSAVVGNVTEARKRLRDSAAEVQRGQAALAGSPPDLRAAGGSARRVIGALAEAAGLLDAIERLANTLDEARARVDDEIRAAAADLAAAQAAAASGRADPAVAQRLAGAATLLDGARAAAAAAQPDVQSALRDAQRANTTADEVLAGIREAEAQRAREAAALQAALRTAEVAVARASDYISSRRTGVGREARTRLAEAERHLAEAQAAAATDPPRATAEAQEAARLADDAYRLARSDFDDWDSRGGGDLGKLILGGIILGNILGGRRGGGWGGTPWGVPGGRSGWGGGGFGGGGFGGRGGGGGWSIGGGGGGGRGGSGGW